MLLFGALALTQPGAWREVFAAAALACLLWLAYSAVLRLHYGPDRFTVTAGPWRRGVDLHRLTQVSYRRSGRSAVVVLRDATGASLPVDLRRFGSIAQWAPLILAAAERTHARVDPAARTALERSARAERPYLP
ncbi:hypothetical protein [Micromonospora sp. DPT]|uniref:hypothetical protein n=1 Tax=Micromonospora sp. DPT TaxID=3142975 RepID=UPI00320A8029